MHNIYTWLQQSSDPTTIHHFDKTLKFWFHFFKIMFCSFKLSIFLAFIGANLSSILQCVHPRIMRGHVRTRQLIPHGGFRVHCQRGPMVYKFVFLKLKNHRTNLSTNMTCTYESLDVLMFTCRWGKGSPGERRLLKRGWSRWVRWERALHRLSRWVV